MHGEQNCVGLQKCTVSISPNNFNGVDMENNYVPLICYYDGELQHNNTRDPIYVGGHNRADRVRKDISFTEFAIKVHEICKSRLEETTIDIKCSYLVNQHTSIAMCVEDDSSLSIVMDLHPHQCNAIVVYVEKRIAPKSSTTTLSSRHNKDSSSGAGACSHMANTPVQVNVNQLTSDGLDNIHSLVMCSGPSKGSSSSPSHENLEWRKELEIISESNLQEVRPHDYNTSSPIANEGLGQAVGNLFEESSTDVIATKFLKSTEKYSSVTGSSLPDRHKKGSSSSGAGDCNHMANTPVQLNVNQLASDGLDNVHSLVMYSGPSEGSSSSPSHEKLERRNELEIISESNLQEVRPHDYNTRSTIANEGLGQAVGNLFEESSVDVVIDPKFLRSTEIYPHSSVARSSLPDRSQGRRSKLCSKDGVLHLDNRSKSSNSWFTMRVLNPKNSYLQRWNKIFLSSCMVALALDALFLYTPGIDDKKGCHNWDKSMEITACVLRSIMDIIYVVHIIFQFRTGFFAPSSRSFGKVEFIEDLGTIARRYFSSLFLIDVLAVLPLPQVWMLSMTPQMRGSIDVRMRNSLLYVVLLQYIPRLLRIYPLYKEYKAVNTVTMFWAGAVLNFSLYILASHIFGAFWYFLSVQREFVCWGDACRSTAMCNDYSLNCGDNSREGNEFLQTSCPITEPNTTLFDFGIYLDALQSGIPKSSFAEKLIYCFWWGLQNIGSLGQNLKTSANIWEVCFAVSISVFGLFLFMFLIGNVQTYLQSDTVKAEREFRKNLQDTEQWMSRKFLPKNLRKQIRQSELYRWQITRGFDDETLLRKLPKDLRMKIKRHLCLESLRRVPLFEVMDDQFMDAMCDCLKPVLYTEKTQILTEGDPVDTMFFFISGELLCLTDDGLGPYSLKAGDFCGEELLTWALNPNSSTLNFPLSERTVQVFTEVEAFSLKADDMKSVTLQFPMLRNKLRHLFRLYSKQWRTWAACYIQAAWRRYKRKQERSRWEEKYKLQGGLDQNAESSPGFGITIYESRFVARKTAYNADSEIRGT